jgi:Protein of unknown function (DUF3891)
MLCNVPPMIVNYTEEGWKIITQRAHGLLAMQIGMFWNEKERPRRWAETLVAIAEHDDAEVELDGERLLTKTGGPLNFDMKAFDLGHCERLYDLVLTKSRFIALLTAYHMNFLYRNDESKDPQCKAFFKKLDQEQHRWTKELEMSTAELKTVYPLLEWCDAFSLLICQDQLQPEKRSVEISQGPDKRSYLLHKMDEKTLTVTPWNFCKKEFEVHYEYRCLPQISFSSDKEFREAFRVAEVKEQCWTLKRTGPVRQPKKV